MIDTKKRIDSKRVKLEKSEAKATADPARRNSLRPALRPHVLPTQTLAMAASILLSLFFCLSAIPARADASPFDLTGPPIKILVTRGVVTLPISRVPNLQPGDVLWIHPELPADQAAHYLMVVVFLRGSTNPPPDEWFTRTETWQKKGPAGTTVKVPEGAEQAVVYLAPETGGDFNTLRSSVRGRPGSFVRATQDLNQASLERSRLDVYLAEIHQASERDPATVHDKAVVLARSLGIRLEDDCFKKPIDQQPACLTAKSDTLILNDGHGQSMLGTLTNGPSSDLIGQLSYTPQAGSGYFSPYVGAIVDVTRIFDAMRTAQYQYLPALTIPKDDVLELKLNNPPSFHNPKSVIVIPLPAIQKAPPPPLRAVDPKQASCLAKNPLVLPVVGAPLVFSTSLMHDMVLHIDAKGGDQKSPTAKSGTPAAPQNVREIQDIPVHADAAAGGYVVDATALSKLKLDPHSDLSGTIQGQWGFDSFSGPSFPLEVAKEHTGDQQWKVPPADASAVVVGRSLTLHLTAPDVACVDSVMIKDANGNEKKTDFKLARNSDGANQIEVTLPAQTAPGTLTLVVKQAGLEKTEDVSLHIFGEAQQLVNFSISAGDTQGILHGSRLEEVATVELKGVRFAPDPKSGGPADQLALNGAAVDGLNKDETLTAKVVMKDGRNLDVPVTVEARRPRVALLNKSIESVNSASPTAIHLSGSAELPLDGHISFSLKSEVPAAFPPDEKIEVATADESFHVLLSIADGSLTLQDPKIAVAQLDPMKSFGGSAFGTLRLRPVDPSGVKGEWIPLATLVRVPVLTRLSCPSDAAQPCVLSGNNLFQLDSVAADKDFSTPATVPEGFVDPTLSVPHPGDGSGAVASGSGTAPSGTLFVKLRDDPAAVDTVTLPITQSAEPQTPAASQNTPRTAHATKASAQTPAAAAK